ncbi:MAG: hypothetical protein E7C78_04645, partial [Dermabacter sp.]|nr:hypothetical protein [Dermabacter sp.]
GVGLPDVVHAAWGLVLRTLVGCEPGADVVFATSVSGRDIPVPGVADAVGMQLNTIPVVAPGQSDPTLPVTSMLHAMVHHNNQVRDVQHVSPRFAAHQGAKDQPPRRVHHIRQAHTRCPSTLRQANSPRIVYQQLPALERTRRIRAQHRGAYLAHFLAPDGHIGFRVSARHPSHAAGHSGVRVVARDPGIVIPVDLQEIPQHDGHGPSVGDQVMHRLDHGDVLATHRTIDTGREHNGPSHERLGRGITGRLQGDSPRDVVSGNRARPPESRHHGVVKLWGLL